MMAFASQDRDELVKTLQEVEKSSENSPLFIKGIQKQKYSESQRKKISD